MLRQAGGRPLSSVLNHILKGRKEDARSLIERCARVNKAEVPPQLLESMEATVAREIAEERALDKVRNTRWSDRVETH